MLKHLSQIIVILLLVQLTVNRANAQVELRDTVIAWQHHQFELNDDYGMKSYSTTDTDIQQVTFNYGKVLENELIRLVLLPEYGGRVLSFVYKPTGYEYLYQSECGSPYGIGDGNFYYNWLMVYGGIFPTFPEPEHGKTWLAPWEFSIIKQQNDTIRIRMAYTDSTSFDGAPGQFTKGITNMTCQVDISVYAGSALWDFEVTLINNEPRTINYEYWTCTTLAPGSMPGQTGTPLNSEMVIPVNQYLAGWSPGGWIGSFNGVYDFENINFLSDWDDMGIAYANELKNTYWGVINHENEEGIFRMSDNLETYGVKLWTWGKNNIDNNLFDWSNGGADNYIELWAGVSRPFFTGAVLEANQQENWNEAYCPTTGLTAIDAINDFAALNLTWIPEMNTLGLELNTFNANETYNVKLFIDDIEEHIVFEDQLAFKELGHFDQFNLDGLALSPGLYTIQFELYDEDYNVMFQYSEMIELSSILSTAQEFVANDINILSLGGSRALLRAEIPDSYRVKVITMGGRQVFTKEFAGSETYLRFPGSGVYIISVESNSDLRLHKIYIP